MALLHQGRNDKISGNEPNHVTLNTCIKLIVHLEAMAYQTSVVLLRNKVGGSTKYKKTGSSW